MRLCIIFNPAARGEKAALFRKRINAWSSACTLSPTTAPGSAVHLAADAVAKGFDTIVAAGGDGTLNEVLNGIALHPDGLARTRLAVLPLGTVNVFAKEIGMPEGLEAAWKTILTGRDAFIDLPMAEFETRGKPERRYFAQLAGAGLDSRAIELVTWQQKKRFRSWAYVLAALRTLRAKMPGVVVSTDHANALGELVIVGNGRFYGGKFNVFTQADLRDGLLEIAVLPRVNLPVLFQCGWGWLTNQLHTSGGIQNFRSAAIRLTSDQAVPLQLDGEIVGQLPANLTIRRRVLRIIIPTGAMHSG